MRKITHGDCLAGGGGLTEAISQIENVETVWVLNHDPVAIRTNLFHHKNVNHYWSDLYVQNEKNVEPCDFTTAGIECTQFSIAKGGKITDVGAYRFGYV